jgi:hypothetical protein
LVSGAISKIKNADAKASQNKEREGVVKGLVSGAIGKIQAKENKNIANASKSLVSGAISKIKNADAKASQNKERENNNNGVISAAALAPKPVKPSLKAIVQKNKERRVMNAVKGAARVASNQKKLSEATGAQRVLIAKQQRAVTNRDKGKNVTAVAGIFKTTNVRKAAEGAARSAKVKLASIAAKEKVRREELNAAAKRRVKATLKGQAYKNERRYFKMIDDGNRNKAMTQVDLKARQLNLPIQPKLNKIL